MIRLQILSGRVKDIIPVWGAMLNGAVASTSLSTARIEIIEIVY